MFRNINFVSTFSGALAGATLTYLYFKYQNKKNNNQQQQQIQIIQEDQKEQIIDFDSQEYKDIVVEQLVRNTQFFGEQSQKKIMDSFVIVTGVGGVGSHLCVALARSGVQKIRIIDFDQITLSSLNRHAFATREDVGVSKVKALKNYIKKIFPHINVEIKEDYLTKDNIKEYITNNPDYVIDCIDNIDAKVALISYCKHNNIKIISSCGAGMKEDPTQIQIRDLFETNYDDLARSMRQKLKKLNVHSDVTVVFSSQKTEKNLVPLKDHQLENPREYKVFSNYRLRTVPVIGTMPAIFGYSLAAYVLCDLAGQLFKPYIQDEIKQQSYIRLFNIMSSKEKKLGIDPEDFLFDLEDIYIIAREAYQWRSIITNQKNLQIEIVKWDPKKPADVYNIVLMTNKEIAIHQQYDDIEGKYPKEIYDRFQEKLEIIKNIIDSKRVLYK